MLYFQGFPAFSCTVSFLACFPLQQSKQEIKSSFLLHSLSLLCHFLSNSNSCFSFPPSLSLKDWIVPSKIIIIIKSRAPKDETTTSTVQTTLNPTAEVLGFSDSTADSEWFAPIFPRLQAVVHWSTYICTSAAPSHPLLSSRPSPVLSPVPSHPSHSYLSIINQQRI